MTGFGSARGEVSLVDGRALAWAWEIKSVNGRGLDIRFRLPPGFDALEGKLRKAAAVAGRGSLTANLQLDEADTAKQVSVDENALA
ncbi:MAG: YicC/YloC family endoribonuclease, partial [Pseudomonadota bacterium]